MRYIALLRAINVGGNRIVKMANLQSILTEFGLQNIKTYIQSGNVIFDSPETDAEALARRLEAHLHLATGFEIPTALRSLTQWEALLPLLPERAKDQRLNVYFLGGTPHAEATERLKALEQEGLSLQLTGQELILLTPRALKDKRLESGNWLEKQLGIWATARNDNTVRKLHQLALSQPS